MVSLSGAHGVMAQRLVTGVALATVVAVMALCLLPLTGSALGPPGAAITAVSPSDDETALSEKITQVFKHPAYVTVEQPGPVLWLTFVNTRFNDLPMADQKTRARVIARFAANNHVQARRIRGVVVQFAHQPSIDGLGLAAGPPSIAKYVFMRSQLR